MTRLFFNKGLTLLELIIAIVLVSVVMLGVTTINIVLSNTGQDYGQRYLVKAQTQAALDHILNNASLAVGSANVQVGVSDKAILSGWQDGSMAANTICIHQGPNSNFINANTDIWLCYQWIPAQHTIVWCAEPYPGLGIDPRGASACTTAAVLLPAGTLAPTFLGTAFRINPNFKYINQSLFTLTITNCLNDTEPGGTCVAAGPPSGDPVNNPEVQISGSVIPMQASSS